MYFQRIGASGYALGKIKVVAPPVSPGLWLHYAAFIDGIRETIDNASARWRRAIAARSPPR